MDRLEKLDLIEKMYRKRMIQTEIALILRMSIKDVSSVLRKLGYYKTRGPQPNTLRNGEYLNPIILAEDFPELDKYNFDHLFS